MTSLRDLIPSSARPKDGESSRVRNDCGVCLAFWHAACKAACSGLSPMPSFPPAKATFAKNTLPLFYKALQTTIVCKSLQTPWGTGRMAVLDTTNVAHCCVPTTVCVHEDSAVVDSVCALVFLVRGLPS